MSSPSRSKLVSSEKYTKPNRKSLIHALNISSNRLLSKTLNNALISRIEDMKKLYLHDVAKFDKNNFCKLFSEQCNEFIRKYNDSANNAKSNKSSKSGDDKLQELFLLRYIYLTNESIKETKALAELLIKEETANPDIYKYYNNYEGVNDPFIEQILTKEEDFNEYKKTYTQKYFKTNDKYFILIGEENFWQNKMNSDIFKDKLKIEKMYYSYDTNRIVSMLKEYLIRLGYTQTFIPTKSNIDLVYYNSIFSNNIYYKTPAKIKNVVSESSTLNIIHKDKLYLNMCKFNPEEKPLDCMAASIVVYYTDRDKENKISKEYLKEHILDQYLGKYDNTITETEHYIVRPVQFIEDPRFSAGVGGGIIILNFTNDTPDNILQSKKNILALLEKYKSVIISKFIHTRTFDKKIINLRTIVFASITKLEKQEHYNLRSYLCHIMEIMSSETNTDSQSAITSYNNVNTHSNVEDFKIYPMDLLKLKLITEEDVKNYKKQMINIIRKVMNIFKLECQIYNETENGFMELGFDFMIGLNNKIYLAEINTDIGLFDFRNSKQLLTSQYSLYNNNMMDTVIRGIIEPVLITNKYINNFDNFDNVNNLDEYDGFTEIVISENLENERGRENWPIKEKLPIKEEEKPTTGNWRSQTTYKYNSSSYKSFNSKTKKKKITHKK